MSKCTREMTQTISGEDRGFTIEVDVYDVLRAFAVTDPAIQHAVKKLLCTGNRGHKDRKQDLEEAVQSIERAIDVLMVEESFAEVMAAMCEAPPDPPQLFDCPFTIGDMISPKVNPDDHWYICAVMADSMLLQKPGRNEDFMVPAVYYDRWQLCTEDAEQPPVCPWRFGDVIRTRSKSTDFDWTIVEITPRGVECRTGGRGEISTFIPFASYKDYDLVKDAEADSSPACPFKVGDVIRSIKYPDFVFHVTEVGSDYVRAYNRKAGSNHIIARDMWNSYEIKTMIAVDKPDATC